MQVIAVALAELPVADPGGVTEPGPLLKGCMLSKILCPKVLCTLYAHTGATHFSFTVAITAHVCQLNNFPYQEFNVHSRVPRRNFFFGPSSHVS